MLARLFFCLVIGEFEFYGRVSIDLVVLVYWLGRN